MSITVVKLKEEIFSWKKNTSYISKKIYDLTLAWQNMSYQIYRLYNKQNDTKTLSFQLKLLN